MGFRGKTSVLEYRRRAVLGRAVLAGFAAGALYWLADCWLHAYLGDGTSFLEELLQPRALQLIPRILVAAATVTVVWLLLKLRYDEQRLRFTQFSIDKAGDPVFWVRSDSTIAYVNESACSRLGYTSEELTRLSVFDIDPNFPSEKWPALWDALRKQKVAKLETAHRTITGETFPVEITANYISYGGQELDCAFARDISEQKKTEQDLKDKEERVRLLLDSTGEGIIGVNLAGECTFVNPACVRLLGYDAPEELLGKDLHRLVHHSRKNGSTYPTEDCSAHRAMDSDTSTFVDDEVFWRRDGTSLEVEYNFRPVHRNSQRVGGVYVFSDISKRKHAERELLRYAADLKEANRLKDLFTDILRHDLMNPASAIKASSELLQRLENEPRKAKIVEAIVNSTQRLIELCESASRYAKVSGTESLSFADVDLGALLRSVAQEFRSKLGKRTLRLELTPEARYVAQVNAVITDVFSNLVSNAIKYSPDKSTIGIAVRDQGTDWLVSVSDQGDGIPDKDKGRIFTRFERLEKKGVKGTGLGLAIAKQVVDLHHGAIWIEDNAGGGSIFRVRIPKTARTTRKTERKAA